jgi:hypothetical protein
MDLILRAPIGRSLDAEDVHVELPGAGLRRGRPHDGILTFAVTTSGAFLRKAEGGDEKIRCARRGVLDPASGHRKRDLAL